MKTKKAASNKAPSKEVAAYEQEVRKMQAGFQRVRDMGNSPRVKAYLEAQEAAKQPDKKTQERKAILHDAREQLYEARRKFDFIHVALTSGNSILQWIGDNEEMGLHLLMTDIVRQLQKTDDEVSRAQKAA